LSREQAALLSAIAAATMLLGPVFAAGLNYLLKRAELRAEAQGEPDLDFDESGGRIIVIGGGRFGQMVNQALLAGGYSITVIDKDVELIKAAVRFGGRIYYGDGARLDVLRAAGADNADILCVCIDDKEAALRIVEIAKANFPLLKLFVRSYDRIHAIDLINRKVDYLIRETIESALSFGGAVLQELGVAAEQAGEIVEDVRRRDFARLMKQQAEGMSAGADLLRPYKSGIKPEPLTAPKGKARALSEQTQVLIDQDD
jgi:glutathione-regulated potassium-efflux system protein KefB